MDEKKPVELNDTELEDVSGGYYWDLTYKKGDELSLFCTACDKSTNHICTSPTAKTSQNLVGYNMETTFVCSVCGKGNPIVVKKRWNY